MKLVYTGTQIRNAERPYLEAPDYDGYLMQRAADALADFTEEEHRMACEYASGRCARVLNTAEVLEHLNAGALVTAAEPELRKVCA